MWGATLVYPKITDLKRISIHAPVWGATVRTVTTVTTVNFNPRTRVGCDNQVLDIISQIDISIHAPVWGATIHTKIDCHVLFYFNPRTRVGCDRDCRDVVFLLRNFNPRTRVGCDVKIR